MEVARFQFADLPRSDARAEIAALTAAGYAVYILSGDSAEKVRALAAGLALPADRAIGDLTQFGDGLTHFFSRFARINGDNPVGAFDKGLIRQSVSDQRPHTLTNFIKLTPQNLGLFGMFHVCDLPARKCDCLRIISGKRSLKIPARRLCHSRTLDRFVFMRNPTRSPLFFPFFGIF